ncbi:glycosyltransferase involved in cell wall bisynthesis [Jatrophihabitans sp. GAS493]|uniref:glycosyltransferase n=1 Tax=Jatrophihabitans sp. GAS493 TaxID=1907575 RepID=UPI000BB94757|nr:glycosyltransferase [Jatrophihabitans sp. GAS493]SOD71313.1 glycosyltransferase involved in cell wall bisynthesis [Jatrophihabitans sp. GAS493]
MQPLKIVGWAQNGAGQGYYRIAMPMWALGIAGHQTISIDRSTTGISPDIDVLVGQLVTDDARDAIWQEMATRADRNFAMIFEIDDDPWAINADNPAREYYTPERLRVLQRNLELSDAVTVSTPRLAEVVGQYNPNVYVLPNCVDASLIFMQRPPTRRLTVGWAGGSAHREDFASVSKELRQFFRRNAKVESHLIGGRFSGLIGRPLDRFTPWSATPEEFFPKIDFDIAIAPLAHNDFNRAKSDLKFVEYAALGIPTVATDFGPYADTIQHGVTGFLAKSQRDWGLYLQALVNDASLRSEIGANARKWAAGRTIHGNYGRWESVYAEVLTKLRNDGPGRTPATTSAEVFAK